jgi:hypothetical protein
LHTDSFSSSLSLVAKFAGELSVRFLTVTYDKIEKEHGDEKLGRGEPSKKVEEEQRKKSTKQQWRREARKRRTKQEG